MKIPASMYDSSGDWLRQLRNRNIHNAASAIIDYRTGEVLAYSGSASYTAAVTKKFQPQFDVLEDGWRQPGSSIKPLDYLVGLDDKTMTAATLFIDAKTNFAGKGQKAFRPTQADGLERGPVRLRSALQFSLNIPATKAGFINGLEHQFERTQEMGLRYAADAVPVMSESIGTIEVHPIDMISAYGAIANNGVLMPRHMIKQIRDRDGKVIWPAPDAKPSKGKRIASAQPSCQRSPVAASTSTTTWRLSDFVGAVPLMNSSVTDLVVAPPGLNPVKASTLALTSPPGFASSNCAIGMPLLASDRIADHSGAEESSEREPRLGSLLELPIHTPATSAGAFLSLGGAR